MTENYSIFHPLSSVDPLKYDVVLYPNQKSKRTFGSIEITFKVIETYKDKHSTRIYFHLGQQNRIVIHSVKSERILSWNRIKNVTHDTDLLEIQLENLPNNNLINENNNLINENIESIKSNESINNEIKEINIAHNEINNDKLICSNEIELTNVINQNLSDNLEFNESLSNLIDQESLYSNNEELNSHNSLLNNKNEIYLENDSSQYNKIQIYFTSFMNPKENLGIYVDSFETIGTHFEPCYIRQCFPAVDNPSSRSIFKLRILLPLEDLDQKCIISNTLEESIVTIEKESIENFIQKSQNLSKEFSIIVKDLVNYESKNDLSNHNNSLISLENRVNHVILISHLSDINLLNIDDYNCFNKLKPLSLVNFEDTPKMSAYVLAFFIGKFTKYEKTIILEHSDPNKKKAKEILIRSFLPSKNYVANDCKWSVDITHKCLQFYNEKFDVDYPLNKIDLVGVQIGMGLAMENFGAISFLPNYLSVNENTILTLKQRITRLIFHEVSHQYFGNLVSLCDWKYLWMKEGMVRLLEFVLVDHFFKEWNFFDEFMVSIFINVLNHDEKSNTHSVQQDVDFLDGTNATDSFDIISYSKGGSVLYMLYNYIGPKFFWQGLNLYMNRYAFKSVKAEYLWDCFEIVSGLKIEQMMESWIKEPHHPFILIESIEQPNTEDNSENLEYYRIRQFKCLESYKFNQEKLIPSKHFIPIKIRSKLPNGVTKLDNIILSNEEKLLSLPKAQFRSFNHNNSGFYRTFLNKSLRDQLIEGLRNDFFSSREVFGILIDSSEFLLHPKQYESHWPVRNCIKLWKTAIHISTIQYLSTSIFSSVQQFMCLSHNLLVSRSLMRLAANIFEELAKRKFLKVIYEYDLKIDKNQKISIDVYKEKDD